MSDYGCVYQALTAFLLTKAIGFTDMGHLPCFCSVRPQLGIIHSEIMSQFVEDCLPDLVTDLGFIGADRLDVLLVEDDAVWPSG